MRSQLALIPCLSLCVLAACVRPQAVPTARPPAATSTRTPPREVKPTNGSAGLGDVLYPQLGNGGYDVQHYTLDLSVDVESNTITATTEIIARATQTLTQFDLDLAGLSVQQVQVNSEMATTSRSGYELIIQPAQSIASGAIFTTLVSYSGQPSALADASVGSDRIGWLTQPNGIVVASEPSGAMSWYPNNNHPSDKATYRFRITVPKPYGVATNGLQKGMLDNGTTRTFVWEARDPIASYLTTLHINEYDVETQVGPHGLPMRNYFPKNTLAAVRTKFVDTPKMIEFIEQRIAPYPFETYGVALITRRVDWALETQTLSTFGPDGGDNDAIFHELMHQWFGNSVSPAHWRDVWLNEGFATYFQFVWNSRDKGEPDLRATMRNWYDWMQDARTGPAIPSKPQNMFSPAVYYRGAYTLHALHMSVGDDMFYKILRAYYDAHKYGNASTEDFIATAESIAGKPARALLTAWLFDVTLPEPV